MRVTALLPLVLLNACATTPAVPTTPPDPTHPVQATFTGPNGGPAYLMACDDGAACYQRAAQACPNGYTIFDGTDKVMGDVTNGQGLVVSHHVIAFECKK